MGGNFKCKNDFRCNFNSKIINSNNGLLNRSLQTDTHIAEMLCAMHLPYAQLFLWLPNTTKTTRIGHVTPKVSANFTVRSNKL